MTDATEAEKSPETSAKPPVPIKYAPFNSRMIAACIDMFVIMTFAMPFTNWMLDRMFPPLDMAPFAALISNHELVSHPQQLMQEALKLALQQNVFVRAFCDNFIQLCVVAAYTLPFWMHYSSTPGKMLLRMEIQDAGTGKKISRGQAIIRFLSYIISFVPLMLGFAWISLNKKHLAWHDKLAHTVVVVKPRKRPAPL